jgi:hypothetical protein
LKKAQKFIFYAAFALLVGAGVIGMLLMMLLGIIVPTLHLGCEAVTTGISSQTSFDSKFVVK